jgi:Carboxypeptidase regulatory-like domain
MFIRAGLHNRTKWRRWPKRFARAIRLTKREYEVSAFLAAQIAMCSRRSKFHGTLSCALPLLASLAAWNLGPVPLSAADIDPCAIAGTVRDSISGAPLRKINVVLYPAGGRTTYIAATNSAGAFSFESVEPGSYRIALQHAGYRSLPGKQASVLMHLEPGWKLTGLELTAERLSAISGTILDGDGQPVVEAGVHAIRPQWWHGRRIWVTVQNVQTNDLGEYRIDNLEPGVYYIRATKPPLGWWTLYTLSDAPGQPEMAPIPVFYPAAATIHGALPLRIDAGREIGGIDLRLFLARTFHIRGTVDPKSIATYGLATDRATYVTASNDDGRTKDWAEFGGGIGTDGSFDIPGVPAGGYLVRQMARTEPLGNPAGATIESRDATGIRLPLAQFDVKIRARFAGDALHDLSKWHASLEPADRKGPALATWPNRPNAISNILPGRYILRVYPNEDAYAKQVFVGGKEVAGPELELASGADELEIVLARGTRDIGGRFAWPDSSPRSATAILVPEQPRPGASAGVYRADLDQRGEFIIWSVPPGRYRAFVVTDFDEGIWENRDFFRLVADRGVVVEVPEGAGDSAVMRIEPKLLPAVALERAIARMAH